MDFLLTLFFFFLIIGFLVFIHEFGHFAAAKITKVPVKEFAIGFGPIIASKTYKGTKYRLNLLPLGGFVNLEGEEDSKSPMGFRNRSIWVKTLILLGGVFMNMVVAVLFFGIFLIQNNHFNVLPTITEFNFTNTSFEERLYPIVTGFNDNQDTFVEETQSIVSIDGEKISSTSEFEELLFNSQGQSVEVENFDFENFEITTQTIDIPGDLTYVARVTSFTEDSYASDFLNEQDVIFAINGINFENSQQFFDELDSSQGKRATFSILDSDGSTEQVVLPELPEKNEEGTILGVGLNFGIDRIVYLPYSQDESEIYAVQYKKDIISPFAFTFDLAWYQIKAMGSLVGEAFETNDFSEVSQVLGSPVAVGDTIGDVVEVRVFGFLIFLTGLISLSLAIFNVLPIPALDGGQLVIAIIEAIRGKQIPDEIVNKVNFVGFAFLMLLSVLIIGKDLFQFNIIGDLVDSIQKIFGK